MKLAWNRFRIIVMLPFDLLRLLAASLGFALLPDLEDSASCDPVWAKTPASSPEKETAH
jgi:hypothetical protein